jgi:uncharacterized protein YkwD
MRSAAGILASLLCAGLLCGSARAADDPYAPLLAPAGTCGAADEQLALDQQTAELTMLCLTNYVREHSGLAPVALNAALNVAGNAKLQADVSCGVFSHEPCGQPFDTVFSAYTQGASAFQIGENIAWGTGSFGTPRSIMNAWLHSAGHRENILTPGFKELGVGYLANQAFQGYVGASLWSQQFGSRSPAQQAPSSGGSSPAAAPAQPAAKKPVAKKKPPHKRRSLRHR